MRLELCIKNGSVALSYTYRHGILMHVGCWIFCKGTSIGTSIGIIRTIQIKSVGLTYVLESTIFLLKFIEIKQ